MIHRTRLLLKGAALLAVLALPASLVAQDAGRTDPAPENTEAQGAAPQRQVPPTTTPTRPAAEPSAAAQRAAPPESAEQDGSDAAARAPARRELLSKMRDAEVLHRERLAVINRLRQLAESQGQSERLALLDKLEVKEGARYNAITQVTATQLGNTGAYKQSMMKLSAGRIRRSGPEATPAVPAPTPEQLQQRKQARAARKAEREAASQADKSKDKPKGEHKQRDTSSSSTKTRIGGKHKRSSDSGSTPAPRTEPTTPAPRDGAPSSGGGTSPRSGS